MDENVYEYTLSSLKSSGLIKYFSSGADLPAPDATKLIELSREVVKIFVKDNNICYKDENDEVICCPNINSDSPKIVSPERVYVSNSTRI